MSDEGQRNSFSDLLRAVRAGPQVGAFALWAIFIALVLCALRLADDLLKPLALALLLFFLLRPLVVGLERHLRVPPALTSALIVATLIAGFVYGTVMLAGPAQRWIQRTPEAIQTLRIEARKLRGPMDDVNEAVSAIERLSDLDHRPKKREIVVATAPASETVLVGLGSFAAGVLFSLLTLFFLLVWGEVLAQRLLQAVLELENRQRATAAIEKTCSRMATYLGTVTLINIGLGGAIAYTMFLLDMPNPVLWGAMACVLNFMPYVGAIIGLCVTGVVSLLTFHSLPQVLWPPLAYLVLTSLEGQLLTPVVLANTFRVNPLIVFGWLVFWAWLWGVAGALVAVPLLMTIVALAEEDRRLVPVLSFIARSPGRTSSPVSA